MALTVAELMILERWCGPVDPADVESFEERLAVVGSPYGLALHTLMMRQAQMTVEAASVAAGDDRVDHSANLQSIGDQIRALVAFLSSSADVTPTAEELRLMAQASGGDGGVTGVITLQASRTRRG